MTPDLQALIELLPECITDLELCLQYEFVGSRITCDPPVLDTDLDVLCMLNDSRQGEVLHALELEGWKFDGNECYANALDNNVGFRSYRNGELNLVLTTDPQFYRLFSAASSVAKRLNLLDKADRIALFQAVIYGNPAEARQPAPTLPGAGGGDARFIVVNIGCIECGVSTNIVGVFSDEAEANRVAGVLDKEMSWREGGQNSYEVFAMPSLNTVADEYLAALPPQQGG